MPRQLPWVNKGSDRRNTARPNDSSDVEDDFFAGTILESSRKGKGKTNQGSDDDLSKLTEELSRPSWRKHESNRSTRLLSSSPPPIDADMPPPTIEYMRKCVDRSDLRDDEWRMVEDELLQTAQLFTKHLHLAEYDRLKLQILERKQEITPRPVVPSAKPTVEAQFKEKAREQTKAQKKAFKDVFAPPRQGKVDKREATDSSRRIHSKKAVSFTSNASRPHSALAKPHATTISDSDDLDAPKRPKSATSNFAPNVPASKPLTEDPPTFTKPALPPTTRPRPSRIKRQTPFEMWDNFTPNAPTPAPDSSHALSPVKGSRSTVLSGFSSLTKALPTPTTTKGTSSRLATPTSRTEKKVDLDDFNLTKRETPSKEVSDRLAKRRADKEREDKQKKAKYDDIPTFLF